MKSKLGSAAFSIFLAFCLWLYVITAVSPGSKETYYNIPVVLEGESVLAEKGLMITGMSAQSVAMELSGNRTDLSRVDSKNITIKVDLTKIYDPGTHAVSYTHSFPGNIANNAFVVESKTPEKLVLNVERRVTKDVNVEVKWIGSAPEGFMSDRENRILDYPAINISGPESVVDQITKAVIEVDLNEQRESISQDYLYTLCDAEDEPVNAEHVVTNVQEVHLDVSIQRVKDIAIACTIVEGGGARVQDVEIGMDVETIRVSGSEAALENMGDRLNIGTLNLAEITDDTVMEFPIVLPEGVKNLTGVTEVNVDVRLNGLAAREFTVQNIQSINVPEGMHADLITEKLTLVVRGPSAQVALLTAENISVSVDFTNAELGTSTFRADVRFTPGFESLGALRIESVSASVTVLEDTEEESVTGG